MLPLPPLHAIAGGLLIGSAAGLFLLLTGRIAGISGLTANALGIARAPAARSVAIAFIVGLPIGTGLIALFRAPSITITQSVPLLIAAGLLVGFGTRLGNGCTSGHGVCGIARLSPRSLFATITFMIVAMACVALVRPLLGA